MCSAQMAHRRGMRGRVLVCIACLLVGGTEMHTLALVEDGYSVTVCVYYEHDPTIGWRVPEEGEAIYRSTLHRPALWHTTDRRQEGCSPGLSER